MTDMVFYKAIREFLLVYLPKQRVCSDNTVMAYRQAINHFIDFIAKKKIVDCPVSDLTT